MWWYIIDVLGWCTRTVFEKRTACSTHSPQLDPEHASHRAPIVRPPVQCCGRGWAHLRVAPICPARNCRGCALCSPGQPPWAARGEICCGMWQLLGEHFLEAAGRDGGEAGRKLRYSKRPRPWRAAAGSGPAAHRRHHAARPAAETAAEPMVRWSWQCGNCKWPETVEEVHMENVLPMVAWCCSFTKFSFQLKAVVKPLGPQRPAPSSSPKG